MEPPTLSYASFLKKFVDMKRPLKVVFDFSNGPTARIVPKIFHGDSRISPIFVDRIVDGNFPAHGPNPMVPKALLHLHKKVKEHHADLGVIFDADGDRAFFVDNKGQPVTPYAIAYLLFLNNKPPYLVDTRVYYSLKYAGLLDKAHTRCSRVGSFFIKSKMRFWDASVGVEYSGHHYFKDFFYSDSGILAAIKVLNAISELPYSFSEFHELLPKKLYGKEMNVRTKEPTQFLGKIWEKYQASAQSKKRFDGIVLEFSNWFICARASNTEPMVRIFVGSDEEAKLKKFHV